ncbi:MAG TPA: hypothetical protein VFE57_14020 [Cyclobacteriaceae bacterium]|nr:hypothetical protein [Cyclobacteriaceae bacterium]
MRNLKICFSQIKKVTLLGLFGLVGGCEPQSDKSYDHCQIQSFYYDNEDVYGVYENGKVNRIEFRKIEGGGVTYYNYKNNILVSTETKNQKGEIINTSKFKYDEVGRWKLIFSGLIEDSAVYQPNKFIVYKRNYTIHGKDTLFQPYLISNAISYLYKSGNL